MARISWGDPGTRFYEAGVDRGVLYVDSLAGVPWVGLISVDESPNGGEAKSYYIDGSKYLNIASTDEFEGTINAYTYPVEFSRCDGTARVRPGLFFGQQPRKPFGLSYRTKIGNDTAGGDYAYKIHLVYNVLASPSPRNSTSYSDSVDATTFSWNITTKSRSVSGYSVTAHVTVDSRDTNPITLAAIENILYGSDISVARLPTPEELITIFDTPVEFSVVDNEDGTFLVAGPDNEVIDLGQGVFDISHSNVEQVDEGIYSISY